MIKKLLYFFIYALAGIGFFFYNHSVFNFKLQAEKEKLLLVKELNFLKNQFNSHITFNFLNYCYSRVHKKLPEQAESIELFADMLRYTIQTKQEKKVPVSQEIIQIENFIKLQKCLKSNIYVTFDFNRIDEDKYILPRILITFVENAFRYGIYSNSQFPIQINLEVYDNKLFFAVKNKIKPDKDFNSAFNSLKNTSKILDLYYHEKYRLKKEEKEGFFNIQLFVTI